MGAVTVKPYGELSILKKRARFSSGVRFARFAVDITNEEEENKTFEGAADIFFFLGKLILWNSLDIRVSLWKI